ncbi:MAG: hypothetical protein HY904_10845 [Deltaproteobacteria bacterium]|nr:hypothetical protein [Deltaproteobacteria bacterium]
MPRLRALRFDSVGHESARLDGLVLDLCGERGDPVDTVLWLRNGGGKSSILSLAFSVLRPNRNDFMGKEQDTHARQLVDYVADDDTATVALEWQADEGDARFLTACTMERQPRGELRRMFWAVRMDEPAHAMLDIRTLPLHELVDGQRRYRKLTALREGLRAFDGRRGVQVTIEDKHADWMRLLDSFGIDPEVFGYQVEMNRREGGADELFRFRTTAEFVDFILEVVMPPDDAGQVSANIAKHKETVRRHPVLVAEAASLEKIHAQLRPLAALAKERVEQHAVLVDAVGGLHVLRGALQQTLDARHGDIRILEAERERQAARYQTASQRRNHAQWAARVFRYRRAVLVREQAERDEKACEDARSAAAREAALADALVPVEKLHQVRGRMTVIRQEIARRQEEHRPLLEEWQHAAATLLACVDADLAGLDEHVAALCAQEAAAEAENREVRDQLEASSRRSGVLAAEIRELAKTLERLEERRTELEARGLLLVNEAAEDAVARATRQHDEAAVEVAASREAEAAARIRVDAAQRAHGEANAENRSAQAERAALESKLTDARREWASWRTHAELARLLEGDAPTLPGQAVSTVERLRARARVAQGRVLELRARDAQADRAIASLENGGLLPGSLAAEQVQQALRADGIQAHLGLAYLVDNEKTGRVAALVTANPELAAGVVVPAGQLDLVAGAPSLAGLALDVPVAVGSTSDLLSVAARRPVHVVPPVKAAWERDAARAELERLRLEREKHRAESDALEHDAQVATNLAAALEQLAARYPPTWESDVLRAVEAAAAAGESAAARAKDALSRQAAAQAEAARAATAALRATERRDRAFQARVELAAFVDQGGGAVETLRANLVERESALKKEEDAASALRARREALDARLGELSERRHAALRERDPLAKERLEVAQHCAAPAAADVSTEVARERFALARRVYERAVGRDELDGQLGELQRQEADHARDVDAAGRRLSVTPEQLAQRLDGVLKGAGVDACRRASADARAAADEALDQARGRNAVAQADAREPERDYQQLRREKGAEAGRWFKECDGWSMDTLAQQVAAREQEATEARGDEAEAEKARQSAEERLGVRRDDVRDLDGWLVRATESMELVRDLPEAQAISYRPLTEGPLDRLDQVQAKLERHAGDLRTSFAAINAIKERAHHASRALVRLLSAGVTVPQTLLDQLQDEDSVRLLDRSAQLADDVQLRATTIRIELDDIEHHRDLLAQELVSVAEPALRVLDALDRSSRFPAHVVEWGGLPFIRARHKAPRSPQERLGVAKALLAQMVTEERVAQGLALVQRLVRELTRGGLTVELLKPEVHRRRNYLPVESMGSFSGGERLTTAILFYCALVKLRALQRGARRDATQVLFLDNPIGTCSKKEFVALQREMAAAHGIQLVYTTGVEDLEALSELPNRLRIRNEKRDTRGRFHARLDAADGSLDVAKVVREASK